MSKLRPIRTTTRAASVKRSDVASAVRSVVVSRSSKSGQFAPRTSSAKKRK